jgi:hypothetical protein
MPEATVSQMETVQAKGSRSRNFTAILEKSRIGDMNIRSL